VIGQELLSGVPIEVRIALAAGRPVLSVEHTNRLLQRHGLARALAEAVVHESVAATVSLTAEEEHPLIRAALEPEGVDGEEALVGWLERRGWSFDDLRACATLQERLRRWRDWRFGSEAEIRFLERKPDLDRVAYSLLRVSDAELAQELYFRLHDDGADFAALVEAFSEGSETATRGLIGPVAVSAGYPELSRRLRVGAVGQIWPPFELAGFWLLIRLERRLPVQLDPPMASRMVEELFDLWVQERVERLLEGEELPPVSQPPPAG
jgi:parvulin-like peptidyl-prolyl isomerase